MAELAYLTQYNFCKGFFKIFYRNFYKGFLKVKGDMWQFLTQTLLKHLSSGSIWKDKPEKASNN